MKFYGISMILFLEFQSLNAKRDNNACSGLFKTPGWGKSSCWNKRMIRNDFNHPTTTTTTSWHSVYIIGTKRHSKDPTFFFYCFFLSIKKGFYFFCTKIYVPGNNLNKCFCIQNVKSSISYACQTQYCIFCCYCWLRVVVVRGDRGCDPFLFKYILVAAVSLNSPCLFPETDRSSSRGNKKLHFIR